MSTKAWKRTNMSKKATHTTMMGMTMSMRDTTTPTSVVRF
jgi:hypothetical protein